MKKILSIAIISWLLAFMPIFAYGDEIQKDVLYFEDFNTESTLCNKVLFDQIGTGSSGVVTSANSATEKCGEINNFGGGFWSIDVPASTSTSIGQCYQFSADIMVAGEGCAVLVFDTFDKNGDYLGRVSKESVWNNKKWEHISTNILIDKRITNIKPVIMGAGKAIINMDKVAITRVSDIEVKEMKESYFLSNEFLELKFIPENGIMQVKDLRNGQTWNQIKNDASCTVIGVEEAANALELKLFISGTRAVAKAKIVVIKNLPEISVEIDSDNEVPKEFAFPMPFATPEGTDLIIPAQEGMSFPVEDTSIPAFGYSFFDGNSMSMNFYGATDGEKSYMTIVETRCDAKLQLWRGEDNLLFAQQYWKAEKGFMGYTRRLKYVFADKGGFVAMCKRYREYAKEVGRYKSLAQKARENPSIDKLVGSANIWFMSSTSSAPDPVQLNGESEATKLVSEMSKLGMKRILWSSGGTTKLIKEFNRRGILTSVSDHYGFAWDDPGTWSKIRRSEFPSGLIKGADGKPNLFKDFFIRSSGVEEGQLCEVRQLIAAKKEVPIDLKKVPYKARFIDTATADEWHECYDHKHPVNRTTSKNMRMELLKFVNKDMKLVVGSETGIDEAVPFVDYFEGMLSIMCGRSSTSSIFNPIKGSEEPEIAKYQFNYQYRVPLWELVYHDCLVSTWYWGENNNCITDYWDYMDCLNVLYGTSPMYAFDIKIWNKDKKKIAASYKKVTDVVREIGYEEMTGFEYLTTDRSVQKSTFANGTEVIVNLGNEPFTDISGTKIQSRNFRVYN